MWDIVNRTPDMQPIKFRWVFTVKTDDNGAEYAKARLTVKGFMQRDEFEPNQIYTPVAEITLIRIMLVLASRLNLILTQVDTETAFLYGSIDELVYVEPPDGSELDPNEYLLRLNK